VQDGSILEGRRNESRRIGQARLEPCVEWAEQRRAGLGQPAADNDDLRIEQGGDVDGEIAERSDDVADDLDRRLVSGLCELEDAARVGDGRSAVVGE
jgi:hypothetical protein